METLNRPLVDSLDPNRPNLGCTTPSAHSSPPPLPSPLLPPSGCPTQIKTLRIASTQALIDAVNAALPSPPLPPLPPYEVGESSNARPTGGRGIDYGFVSTLDAEERRRGNREVGYGIRDTWVDPAEAVPEITPMTWDEDNTRGREGLLLLRERLGQWIGLIHSIHYELQTHHEQVYAHESQLHAYQTQLQLHGTLIQTQHQIVETLRVMRDMRREMGDMQAKLLALREQRRRARQPGPDVRIPYHQDAFRDADSHI
ncbi:hypothetical protein Tco_0348128 [Tanacetum coccineum]